MAEFSKRHQGDDLADQAFAYLKEHPKSASKLYSLKSNADLSQIAQGHGALSELISVIQQKEISNTNRGSVLFEKHVEEIFLILGLYSLPYCYAGAKGARVLINSKKILDHPDKRLLETADFVMETCRNGGFDPEGSAKLAILKVRLMHAAARFYASQVITDEVPVNQEDMLATLFSFSLIVIRGLRKIGVSISGQQAAAYMDLWMVIGELMGIDAAYLPEDIRSASVQERAIRKREFSSSPEGQRLTRSLTDYLNEQTDELRGVNPVRLMRQFLGDEIADIIAIPSANAITGELVFVGLRLRSFISSFNSRNFASVQNGFNRYLQKSSAYGSGAKLDYKIT